ncbi:FkbM family methyltransferase [Belliella sp. DSM 107340]|uniref:FkbM family methyltransferase n=1 Tax=Belliella calami TaxID=2923436 RepID=A0ABS9UIK9_9BACT|nr:FkbM family methyltransferase [Belliella calami]MCH7396453.1 FkbM family methyltransferase [Belliella calami]
MFFKKKKTIVRDPLEVELERIKDLSYDSAGQTDLFGPTFKFHHARAFYNTYLEIFQEEIYRFEPLEKENGIILDCGANMGLSVLFFSLNYPNHQIHAFEPDPGLFDLLKENVESFGLKNVNLNQKAIWTEETVLSFQSDGGMGGRVNELFQHSEQPVVKVSTVMLSALLDEKIDFLKIDIEGAEDEVIRSCKGKLKNANHLFFEYHNDINKPQTLHELLEIVSKEGFKYHIKESSARNRPFVDQTLICERFDMAITVFCYR